MHLRVYTSGRGVYNRGNSVCTEGAVLGGNKGMYGGSVYTGRSVPRSVSVLRGL